MAKTSIIEREKKREFLVEKYSTLRKFLKGKIKSSETLEEKLYYQAQLQRLPRNSSYSRLLCLLESFLNKVCLVNAKFFGLY